MMNNFLCLAPVEHQVASTALQKATQGTGSDWKSSKSTVRINKVVRLYN